MAGILEYSSNRTNNTAINGIGIAGSDSVKNGNDAIQQLMADAKSAVTKIVDKAAGSYTAVKADYNQLWRVTGTATINLTAAATLSDGWCLWVMADGATATIDPNGSEKINGADTLALEDGSSALIICTSTEFRAVIFNKPFDSDTLGDAALLDVGTTAGTVAAGDDSRITGALPKSDVLDEDDMASNSATKPASQKSIKTFVESQKGLAKAWVNFNGTGTVTIRDSHNVSSITDNGTGSYTINFANALADANFVVAGSAQAIASGDFSVPSVGIRDGANRMTTAKVDIRVTNTASTGVDSAITTVVIFGS